MGLRFCASKMVYFIFCHESSAYKAEPTSGAKLVKGVKEELKKCPRPETPASETQEYQKPQRICFKNSKVSHLWFYKGIENAKDWRMCLQSDFCLFFFCCPLPVTKFFPFYKIKINMLKRSSTSKSIWDQKATYKRTLVQPPACYAFQLLDKGSSAPTK